MNNIELKIKVRDLRIKGNTYSEIQALLDKRIPKSTLSCWCHCLNLSEDYKQKLIEHSKINLEKARKASLVTRKKLRDEYLKGIDDRNLYLANHLSDKDTAKIALAILYITEGSKTNKGSMTLGNSDPSIIKLFLHLLRLCYKVDESKFRCTLQCRADQKIEELEKFWANITKISLSQFYKAQIDPRTINKPSLKSDYKGVCRINYFSAEAFFDLMSVAKVICMGL